MRLRAVYGTDAELEPVMVAGLDGLYVEPYEDPAVQFDLNPQGAAMTGAYALGVGDRILCVYLTWDAATTPDELNAARGAGVHPRTALWPGR